MCILNKGHVKKPGHIFRSIWIKVINLNFYNEILCFINIFPF